MGSASVSDKSVEANSGESDPLRRCTDEAGACLVDLQNGQLCCPWHGRKVSLPLVGSRIPNYRIEKVISGSGGFSVVYRADNNGVFQAMKVQRPPGCYQREAVEGFIAEGRWMADYFRGCDNIVQVSHVGKNPWPFIMMEYVE